MSKKQKEEEEIVGSGRKLTRLEERILLYLFKFRFLKSIQIRTIECMSEATIRRSLKNLVTLNLVSRKYETSYRLLHLPAIYSLSPTGVTYLKHMYSGLPLRSLQLFYKNNLILNSGVQTAIFIGTVFIELTRQLGDTFEIFSRYELLASLTASNVPDLRVFSSDDTHSTHIDIYATTAKLPRNSLIKIIREAPTRRSDPANPVHVFCEDEISLRRVYALVRRYGSLQDFSIQKLGNAVSFTSEN